MDKNKLFYVGQKALIVNSKNEVLVLTTPEKGLDFPGGQILIGEKDLTASLKREVKEETTLEIIVHQPFATWSLDVPTKNKSMFFVGYTCALLSGEVELSDEHISFTWVDKTNYRDIADETIWFEILERFFDSRK